MILNVVNYRLRMFNPHSQREGFAFYQDLFVMQQFENIAGRMPGSQDDGFSQDFFVTGGDHSFDALVPENKVSHFGVKTTRTSTFNYYLPHGCNDPGKFISTYVRMCIV